MELNNQNYQPNDYLDGECPKCHDWEAPITTEELMRMSQSDCYHGATTPQRDRETHRYVRQKWREFFQCPKCQKRFSVLYTNV